MSRGRNIVLVEPFMGGSHAAWANGYQRHTAHRLTIISQSGAHWKWRMHGGAITCARKVNALPHRPDLLLCTDMLDAAVFRSLLKPDWRTVPLAVYFHENQLTYPWKAAPSSRDLHYAFINYTSALAADRVFFNSDYHREVFLAELPKFLRAFPDDRNEETVREIKAKSEVLHVGMDLKRFQPFFAPEPEPGPPLLLWNHRHEHDKNPEDFFALLFRLENAGVDYRLAVAGETYADAPAIFAEAREKLAHRIAHWGFCPTFAEYARLLCRSAVLPVTSNQEFFGISVSEAIHCGVRAILPNRLSYPGLFGQAADFYTTADELFDKTLRALSDTEKRAVGGFTNLDWEVVAPQYDSRLAEMAG